MQLGIRSCGNETNSRLLRACSDNALAKTNLSPAPAVELGVSLSATPTDIEHSGLPRHFVPRNDDVGGIVEGGRINGLPRGFQPLAMTEGVAMTGAAVFTTMAE